MIKIKLTDIQFANKKIDGGYTLNGSYYSSIDFDDTLRLALSTLGYDFSEASNKQMQALAKRFELFYRDSNRHLPTVTIYHKTLVGKGGVL